MRFDVDAPVAVNKMTSHPTNESDEGAVWDAQHVSRVCLLEVRREDAMQRTQAVNENGVATEELRGTERGLEEEGGGGSDRGEEAQ
jgi:hypothetical protein